MSEIRVLIEELQASGMVVQGLSLDQIEDILSHKKLSLKDQLIALLTQGRSFGVYFFQDQAGFDQSEFARKLGEIGFGSEQAKDVIAYLRPAPTLDKSI